MRIEQKGMHDNGENIYTLTFEPVARNGLHEAHIALNAIAAANRKRFAKGGALVSQHEKGLKHVTQQLLESGIDSLVAGLQQRIREKSREGVLDQPVTINTLTSGVDYVFDALADYRNKTVAAVQSEPISTTGNMSALNRTFEGVTADEMLPPLIKEMDYIPEGQPDARTFGFAQALEVEQDT